MRRPTNEINDRQIGLYNAVLWNENSISRKAIDLFLPAPYNKINFRLAFLLSHAVFEDW